MSFVVENQNCKKNANSTTHADKTIPTGTKIAVFLVLEVKCDITVTSIFLIFYRV